ncbi:MAG: hypothetical protein NZ551_05980 [Microscillaceae bacterium]|nr:hypothetical protein [Microscillaceae bacterium]MDW8460742.1 hypothetical protein [Cytophagales bacterium]
MKKNIILILSTGILIISSCRYEPNKSLTQEKGTEPNMIPVTIHPNKDTSSEQQAKQKHQTFAVKNIENQQIVNVKITNKQADIIAKIKAQDPQAKIEFAPFDTQALLFDTTFQGVDAPLELKLKTTSMNDSTVVQEMLLLDVRTTGKKSYLLSHNYQTEVQLRKAGQLIAQHLIKKEFFKDYIQAEFLEKAILKHPEQVELNPVTNTVQLHFLIGVPATDWMVMATLGIKPTGELQILKVEYLGL